MNRKFMKLSAAALALALSFSLAACGREPEPDPHEGMVLVNAGGSDDWITPAEGLAAADFISSDFVLGEDGRVQYTGDGYTTRFGIDVSFYQGEIDWEAAKADGVEFAMIRCGYRGASEGELYEDEMFRQNIEGALEAGLDVGVYFFSQSIGAHEAAEEALYVLELIEGYNVTMPVAFDWEPLDDTRSDGVDVEALTDSAEVFCKVIKDAGYEPSVYFYRSLAYYDYDLSQLADFSFWVGAPGEYPDFYYDHSIWQYSFTGRVAGIDHDVDLNLEFTRVPAAAEG